MPVRPAPHARRRHSPASRAGRRSTGPLHRPRTSSGLVGVTPRSTGSCNRRCNGRLCRLRRASRLGCDARKAESCLRAWRGASPRRSSNDICMADGDGDSTRGGGAPSGEREPRGAISRTPRGGGAGRKPPVLTPRAGRPGRRATCALSDARLVPPRPASARSAALEPQRKLAIRSNAAGSALLYCTDTLGASAHTRRKETLTRPPPAPLKKRTCEHIDESFPTKGGKGSTSTRSLLTVASMTVVTDDAIVCRSLRPSLSPPPPSPAFLVTRWAKARGAARWARCACQRGS